MDFVGWMTFLFLGWLLTGASLGVLVLGKAPPDTNLFAGLLYIAFVAPMLGPIQIVFLLQEDVDDESQD